MQTILGLIRHILTFAGGYAVSEGWLSEDMVTETVGAIATLIGVVWSGLAKQPNIPIK